jgi:hypothetical protein
MPLIAPKPECLNLEFPVNAHERPSRASNPLSIRIARPPKGSDDLGRIFTTPVRKLRSVAGGIGNCSQPRRAATLFVAPVTSPVSNRASSPHH